MCLKRNSKRVSNLSDIFLMNAVIPMVAVAGISTLARMQDLGTAIIFGIGLFYLPYSFLYCANKVKGRMLLYTYWVKRLK